ncbi:hypothetical protein UlMin_037174 [Ulmus minor]
MGGVFDCDGSLKKPLLAVQVTELVDGIFIACSAKHSVMDGTSFWHFFNTWSEISRSSNTGELLSQPPPVFDRHFFNGVFDLPIHIPLTQINTSNQNYIPQSSVVQPPLIHKRVLHFSKEKIAQLKAKANADMSTNKISSLQALMGYLWVSITRNRSHKADEEVIFFILIGLRQRVLQPPLPKQYFGNAILDQPVKCTAGELLDKGSSWAAWKINSTIASFSAAHALKSSQDWVKSLMLPKVEEIQTSNPLVIVSSSPRFDVYGNDFGWGRPVGVRSSQCKRTDGFLVSYPGAEEGSIDFEVYLLSQTLQNMAKDAEFTNTLAI